MTDGTWGKPRALGWRMFACAAIIALHAVFLVVHYPRHDPVRAEPSRKMLTLLFVPFRTIPSAHRDGPSEPRPERLPRQTRQAAAPLADRSAVPVAPGNVPAIEPGADIDPNWAVETSANMANTSDLRSYALSIAGKVDAQSRQGKPVALEVVDTPFQRMQGNMAQAAQGGGTSTTVTTSLSGEPITVIRRNGKARCYVPVSTSVAPSAVFDNRGSGRSTEVNCPKGVR